MSTISGALPGSGRKRRRPAVACSSCRRRKVGCDRKTPCNHCIQYNATCTYHTPEATLRAKSRSISAVNTYSPASPSTLESLHSTKAGQVGRPKETSTPTLSASSNTSSATTLVDPQLDALPNEQPTAVGVQRATATTTASSSPDSLPSNLRGLIQSSSTGQVTKLTNSTPTTTSSRPPLKGRFEKSRFFGQSHWMSSCMQVRSSSWGTDITINKPGLCCRV